MHRRVIVAFPGSRGRIFWPAIICLSLILPLGCRPAAKPVAAEQRSTPAVKVVRVGTVSSVKAIVTVGTVAYRRELQLGFTTGGRTRFIRVQEGQSVPAGFALASLDMTIVQAELAEAIAEQDRASATYSRNSSLAAKGWVNKRDLDTARSAKLSADARVRAARFQSSSATIYAPSAGVVLARLAEPGQVVEAGRPIITFGDRSSGLVIRGAVTATDASRIAIGSAASVTINAASPIVLTGKVIEIGGKADPTTGTFLVEVALDRVGAVRSGQVGTIRLQPATTQSAEPQVTVPLEALFSARGGEGFVLVYDPRSGKVFNRKVLLGELFDTSVVVRGGLKAGEAVVVSQIGTVSHGQSVRASFVAGG